MKNKLILSFLICLISFNSVGCKKTIDYTKEIEPSYTSKVEDLSISLLSKTVEVIDNKNCLVVKANIKNISNELIYPTDFFIIAEQEYDELLVVNEILQKHDYNIAYTESKPIKSNSEVVLDYIFELKNNTPIDLYLWTLNDIDPITLEEGFCITY